MNEIERAKAAIEKLEREWVGSEEQKKQQALQSIVKNWLKGE